MTGALIVIVSNKKVSVVVQPIPKSP